MKHAVEMCSVAIIYIPSFIKIISGIQKLIWGIHRHTDNTEIVYVLFLFQNKESRIKRMIFSTLEISVNSNLYNCKTFSSDS
jgi:hypothetical protein